MISSGHASLLLLSREEKARFGAEPSSPASEGSGDMSPLGKKKKRANKMKGDFLFLGAAAAGRGGVAWFGRR